MDTVTRLVSDQVDFYSIDVALTVEGGWTVIELNDGCLSGLSANDLYVLYKRLGEAVDAVQPVVCC